MSYGRAPTVDLAVTVNLTEENVIDAFHGVYYSRLDTLRWFGVPVLKSPIDMWIYQEILCRTLPDVIIETGTAFGGSAYFMAAVCQLIGKGRILSIDIDPTTANLMVTSRPVHPRVTYLTGSSTDSAILRQVREQIQPSERVMVILDSDHHEPHVSAELEAYAGLVSPDCYLIVEDTNLNGHPVGSEFGPGPWEAVDKWLPEHPEFVLDSVLEQRYVVTFNPRGYFRRLA